MKAGIFLSVSCRKKCRIYDHDCCLPLDTLLLFSVSWKCHISLTDLPPSYSIFNSVTKEEVYSGSGARSYEGHLVNLSNQSTFLQLSAKFCFVQFYLHVLGKSNPVLMRTKLDCQRIQGNCLVGLILRNSQHKLTAFVGFLYVVPIQYYQQEKNPIYSMKYN